MFEFAHPVFLYFLPLTLLPLVLHLLNRQLARQYFFPGTRFLFHTPLPHAGRRRWRDLLLMLCRMAMIALLLLALAKPTRKAPAVDSSATQERVAVVVDDSASMRGVTAELRKALAAVAQEVEDADVACWLTSGQPLTTTALREVEPGWHGASPTQALKLASQWLGNSKKGRAIIISDFQKNNWSAVQKIFPKECAVELRQVGASRQSANAAITATSVGSTGTGQQCCAVTIFNWDSVPATRQVELQIGVLKKRQNVVIPPRKAVAVNFVIPETATGQGRVTLLPADGWPADDLFCFWTLPAVPQKILLLVADDRRSADAAEYLSHFTTNALTAQRDGLPDAFAVTTLGTQAAALADLQEFKAVFILGSATALDQEVVTKLLDVCENGGAVFVVPGRTPAADWLALRRYGLLKSQEGGIAKRVNGIGQVPADSPLRQIFPPDAPSDLSLFAIKSYLRVSPAANEKVLLTMLDGNPALIQRPVGNGNLFAFTFGWLPQDSDFVLSQSFLPLLQELCVQVLRGADKAVRLQCGERLPVLRNLDGTPAACVPPIDGLSPALAMLGERPLECNTPAIESATDSVPLAELQRALVDNDATANNAVNPPKKNLIPLLLMAILAIMVLLEACLILSKKQRT